MHSATEDLKLSASYYSPTDREAFVRSVCEGALKDFPALSQPVDGLRE